MNAVVELDYQAACDRCVELEGEIVALHDAASAAVSAADGLCRLSPYWRISVHASAAWTEVESLRRHIEERIREKESELEAARDRANELWELKR